MRSAKQLCSVATLLLIIGASSSALAQTYPYQGYPQYQQYPAYQSTYQQSARRSGPSFYIQRHHPVVGRSVIGGGVSFGEFAAAGYNAEGAFSFRLESARTFGHRRYLYLMPEFGFVMIQCIYESAQTKIPSEYERQQLERDGGAPSDADFGEELGEHELVILNGMAGMRVGWGLDEAFVLYGLARVLVGVCTRENAISVGGQVGLGIEFWYGLIGIEASYIYNYAVGQGHLSSIRVGLNFDVVRALTIFLAIAFDRSVEFIEDDRPRR